MNAEKVISDSENGNEEHIKGYEQLVDLKMMVERLGVCARTIHRILWGSR